MIELTRDQVEILTMYWAGGSYPQVAFAMSLSVQTVNYHLARVRKMLGAGTTLEAAKIARQLGLIPIVTRTKPVSNSDMMDVRLETRQWWVRQVFAQATG